MQTIKIKNLCQRVNATVSFEALKLVRKMHTINKMDIIKMNNLTAVIVNFKAATCTSLSIHALRLKEKTEPLTEVIQYCEEIAQRANSSISLTYNYFVNSTDSAIARELARVSETQGAQFAAFVMTDNQAGRFFKILEKTQNRIDESKINLL